MKKHKTHFLSPKLEVRENPNKGFFGVYATTFIPEGELLVCWGGKVLTGEQMAQISIQAREHSIQIEENLYQVPYEEPYSGPEDGDYVNHSCEPNAGLSDSITLVAMRDIHPDEEICFDYAMSDSTDYDEFTCGCQTPSCRGIITGNDWQLPHLQANYGEFFSPYLRRRIAKMQQAIQLTCEDPFNNFTDKNWNSLPMVGE